jgi:hypothetical protein
MPILQKLKKSAFIRVICERKKSGCIGLQMEQIFADDFKEVESNAGIEKSG